MSDSRITQLPSLTQQYVDPAVDVVPIADVSASTTKKVTPQALVGAALANLNSPVPIASGGTGATTASEARTNLGLVIGTNIQAWDTDLDAIAALAGTSGLLQKTGAGAWALDTSSYAKTDGTGAAGTWSISISGNAATATSATAADSATTATTAEAVPWTGITGKPTTIGGYGLVDAQPLNTGLTAISGLSPSANKLPYFTGASAAALTDLTATGRGLIGAADAVSVRALLGLGAAATANATISSGASLSGTNTGDQVITLQGDVTGSGTGTFTATIASSAVTATKLANNSTITVSSVAPTTNGIFIGQGWYNTTTSLLHVWDGSNWREQSGLQSISFSDSSILNFAVSTVNGAVTITSTMDNQSANTVLAGPTSGGATTPTFRSLISSDLPVATASNPGAVTPGTGLSVDGAGALSLNTTVAAGTYTKVTADVYGRITAGSTLSASDIPALDASKIATGTFGASYLADGSITASKISVTGLVKMATAGTGYPAPDFLGQFLSLSDGSVYVSIGSGISDGLYMWLPINRSNASQLQIRWGGTWDASTSKTVAINSEGSLGGLQNNQGIPAASSQNAGIYLLTVTAGTASGNAPAEAFDIGDWILSNGTAWIKVNIIQGGGGDNINAEQVLINPAVGTYVTAQDAVADLYNRTRIATDSTLGLVKSSTSVDVDAVTGVATVDAVDCGTY